MMLGIEATGRRLAIHCVAPQEVATLTMIMLALPFWRLLLNSFIASFSFARHRPLLCFRR